MESEAEKIWKKQEKEIKKAIQYDSKKPLFSFLEGPPTANAPPALHHFEVRTFKDIICKFKYMQGFSVPRKGGWDCHGLPVEVQVEKQLQLNSKKDVEKYGIDKFIKAARDSVFSNISQWVESTKKLAYWIDLENPYVTLDNKYIESVWWSLKELYNRGMLYEGKKVVPFCPRCGTPLSSHEVALGYKDVKEDSVYVAFKIKNKMDEYFLAWTTTPWTLPGNVALAVSEKINYVKAKLPNGDKIILSRERLEVLHEGYKIIENYKGKDLVGIEYEPLYDIKELQNKNSHKVVAGDFVTTKDGTGIVHTAVMYGEDDYDLGTKLNLPKVHTVGQDGKFLDIVPKFKGIFVKDAEEKIIQDLKDRKILYKKEKIMHSYPFCWRCSTPLLYYAINSWFIKVSKIREKLVKENRKINWIPEHIKEGRFGNWLEGAKDWA
ncbi:MAG: class I tRNA ligase family protein, partial [Nanoarchaeota archaeon]